VQPSQDHAECVPKHQLVPTFAQARGLSPEVCKTAPTSLILARVLSTSWLQFWLQFDDVRHGPLGSGRPGMPCDGRFWTSRP